MPWWVVALLGTVSEVAAGRVGLCTGAAPQDAAGECIPLALLERLSPGLPLLPCFVPRCLPSRGQPRSPGSPGKWRRSLGCVRGQCPLSRGAAKDGKPPARAGLASPTLPSELAWRHHGARKWEEEEEAVPSG